MSFEIQGGIESYSSDAPEVVSKKQIQADLTLGEIFVIDGEEFDAHTKGRGDVQILIEKLRICLWSTMHT